MKTTNKIFIIKLFFLIAFIISAIIFGSRLFFTYATATAKEENALRLFLPNDRGESQFSVKALLKEVNRKKIIKVELTGKVEEDNKQFEFIRKEARTLQSTFDTTTVLHVHFPEESTYGQFVYLADMMAADKHKRYGITNNDFYIFGEDPIKNH